MSEEKIHKLGRRSRGLSALLVFALVFAQTAAILFLSLAVVSINSRGASSRAILENVDKSTGILVDCTTPGHPCYERGLKNQASAVASLNRVIVLAAYCAKQPANATVPQIQACVVKGLK